MGAIADRCSPSARFCLCLRQVVFLDCPTGDSDDPSRRLLAKAGVTCRPHRPALPLIAIDFASPQSPQSPSGAGAGQQSVDSGSLGVRAAELAAELAAVGAAREVAVADTAAALARAEAAELALAQSRAEAEEQAARAAAALAAAASRSAQQEEAEARALDDAACALEEAAVSAAAAEAGRSEAAALRRQLADLRLAMRGLATTPHNDGNHNGGQSLEGDASALFASPFASPFAASPFAASPFATGSAVDDPFSAQALTTVTPGAAGSEQLDFFNPSPPSHEGRVEDGTSPLFGEDTAREVLRDGDCFSP